MNFIEVLRGLVVIACARVGVSRHKSSTLSFAALFVLAVGSASFAQSVAPAIAPAAGAIVPSSTPGGISGAPQNPVVPAQVNPINADVRPTRPNLPNAANERTAVRQGGDSAAEEAGKSQPKAEPIKDFMADQSEFQRFVEQSTGRRLGLFGYQYFAEPDRYSPVIAVPVPGSYVLGPGDELLIQTFGVADFAQNLVIDRNGRVNVPTVGPLQLAGLPFAEAEKALTAHLSKVYTNFTLSLTMGRMRSIEIFLLGQALKPGKHVVSGLSTLINAMFATGGANSNGSLRNIEVRRGGKTISVVDLYRFLSHGDSSSDVRLQPGDIIFIPPVGARAALLGTVNAPAIYELKSGETIADVLALSGGLPTLAAPQKAQLERVDARREVARTVEDFALDEKGLKRAFRDGDILTVFQVSPQIDNVVTLEGNVAAPMRYTFRPGLRVSDLLGDPRLLIPSSYWTQVNRGANSLSPNRPEVNLDYAIIQRLDKRTLTTRLIAFSPQKAMNKDQREDMLLESGDIVSIYSPTQSGPPTEDSVSISGELVGGVRRFPWRQGMTLKDLIPSTQWLIEYYNYWQRPSAKSVRTDINWDYAQLVRRLPETLQTETIVFNLGHHIMTPAQGARALSLLLKPGDEITLFTTGQVALPVEKRVQIVQLRGEVSVPGSYQLKPGETLLALLQRAGGLTRNAYAYATVFTREAIRAQQQSNLDAAVRRAEADLNAHASTLAQNQSDRNSGSGLQAQVAAQRAAVNRLQALRASGRISLDMSEAGNTLPDLSLEDGDVITVPTNPNIVGVFGAVQAETSFLFRQGATVGEYVERAGPIRDADLHAAMLIRADGSVVANGARRSWLGFGSFGFMSLPIRPGDTVFIPEVVDRRSAYSQFVEGAKDWTAIFYQFGLGAAAIKTLRGN